MTRVFLMATLSAIAFGCNDERDVQPASDRPEDAIADATGPTDAPDADATVDSAPPPDAARPCVEFSPPTHDFGNRVLGQTTPETVLLRNCSELGSGSDLTLTSIQLRSDSSSAFAVPEAGVGTLPVSLGPGEEYPFLVQFTPMRAGQLEEAWAVAELEGADVSEPTLGLVGSGVSNECPTPIALCAVEGSGQDPTSEVFALPLSTLLCTAVIDEDSHVAEYIWTVAERRAGSRSEIIPENGPELPFFIDLAGRYVLALETVDPLGCVSTPAEVVIVSRGAEDLHVQLVWHTPTDPDGDRLVVGGSSHQIYDLDGNPAYVCDSIGCRTRIQASDDGTTAIVTNSTRLVERWTFGPDSCSSEELWPIPEGHQLSYHFDALGDGAAGMWMMPERAQTIASFAADGSEHWRFGLNSEGADYELGNITGAAEVGGRLLVVDQGNGNILAFAADGTVDATFGFRDAVAGLGSAIQVEHLVEVDETTALLYVQWTGDATRTGGFLRLDVE